MGWDPFLCGEGGDGGGGCLECRWYSLGKDHNSDRMPLLSFKIQATTTLTQVTVQMTAYVASITDQVALRLTDERKERRRKKTN